MSGDGPLSIDGRGVIRADGVWLVAVDHRYLPVREQIADQLDRARRCAEAEAENARLRAELAARPDLTEVAWWADRCWSVYCDDDREVAADAATELREAAEGYANRAVDPAPAPTHNHHTRDIRAGCPKCMADHPDINPNDLYAPLVPAPDTVTLTVSREVRDKWAATPLRSEQNGMRMHDDRKPPTEETIVAARAARDGDR